MSASVGRLLGAAKQLRVAAPARAQQESRGPEERRIASWRPRWGALYRFEALLAGREHLMGDDFSAADCAAFPFLKYALRRDPADGERFHRILDDHSSSATTTRA